MAQKGAMASLHNIKELKLGRNPSHAIMMQLYCKQH